PRRFPDAVQRLRQVEGRIDEAQMMRMNAAAELEKKSFAQAAGLFFGDAAQARQGFLAVLLGPDLWRLTLQHVLLVGVSLLTSIAAAVPLGIVAARLPRLGQLILAAAGLIQTIPSLALL